jgi:hypothetical protein
MAATPITSARTVRPHRPRRLIQAYSQGGSHIRAAEGSHRVTGQLSETDPLCDSIAPPPPSAEGHSELVSEINFSQPADQHGSATVVAMGRLLRYAGVCRPVQARELST